MENLTTRLGQIKISLYTSNGKGNKKASNDSMATSSTSNTVTTNPIDASNKEKEAGKTSKFDFS